MSLEPGLCSVTFRALDVATVVDVAVRARLRAVEWGGDVHVPHGDLEAARDAAARTTAAGLRCASYGSYLHAGAGGPVDAVLDTALELGSPNVRVWCRHGVRPGCALQDRAVVTRELADIAERAGAAGLTVSLEFHRGTLTETAESANRLLRDVDAPNLYTYWQPIFGQPVSAVVDRLSHLHVFHWAREGTRLPLADGEPFWQDALATARGAPRLAQGRVAFLEFVRDDDPAQLVADAATLREWLS